MAMDWSIPLADADDAQLEAALEGAQVPAIMATLSHFLGSTDHLAGDIQPNVVQFAEEEDGLSEPQRQEARSFALDVLRAYRDRGCPPLDRLSPEAITTAMHYITGFPMEAGHEALLLEELNLFGDDERQLPIDTGNLPKDYRVLIVGAGMSGILAAARLQQAGIPFHVIDKNPSAGGTWFENTYPGCKVDSANHVYNYSFFPEHQWPGHFSSQPDLYRYFENVVDSLALESFIELNTSLVRAEYNEAEHAWDVTLEAAGEERREQFSTIISAVGQLNTPRYPDIEGLEDFSGVSFHSARWEHQHSLEGKRVAVIGTGCSATQFIPSIAGEVGQLTVFQRTPNWLMPAPEYEVDMTEAELWCFRNIPFYARWYRFFLFRARAMDGPLPFFYTEEGWAGPEGSISAGNEEVRALMIEYIREQTGDTPLFEQLVPDYPPGGKRPVLDNGSWISTLQRDNVDLVSTAIERITPEGILTSDGTLHEADVLILGTGFKANEFLSSMDVVGRGGVRLHEQWGGEARAYMGITIPNFPNFYCLYGPNTNIVVGSSIIFFSECEMRYIMGCLKMQIEGQLEAVECRAEVHDAYNSEIDQRNLQRAWGTSNVSSWYKSSSGRVSQNWPGTHYEFWQQTRAPNRADFL